MNNRIYLSSPHMSGREMKYIQEAFDTNWIAPVGPNIEAFEKQMAAYAGVRYGVALSSCTAAIHLGLIALGVKDGDYVFCSTLTFAGSCNPITYCKATPVFIDSDETFNMSPKALEKAYEAYPNPKALIVVNLYGQCADYDEILKIARQHDTPVIEDAAESLGADYKGKPSGSFGQLGVLSFNGNKIITTSGGGMLLTNDEAIAKKAKFLSTQARDPAPWYQHSEVGYNYRMSNICAGIGLGQLSVLRERIEKKKYIYDFYKNNLADSKDISMMPVCDYGNPNYWLSCILLDKTAPIDIIHALENENIESRPLWKPMHLQPVFEDMPFVSQRNSGCSVSEELFSKGLCLPSDTKMTDDDLKRVISVVKENVL